MFRVFAKFIPDATPKRGQYRVTGFLPLPFYTEPHTKDGELVFTAYRKPHIGTYINPKKELGL